MIFHLSIAATVFFIILPILTHFLCGLILLAAMVIISKKEESLISNSPSFIMIIYFFIPKT